MTLTMIISGESLLNDGTALVIFGVLRQMVQLPDATVRVDGRPTAGRVDGDFVCVAVPASGEAVSVARGGERERGLGE